MAMLTTALIAAVATAVLADYGHAVEHLAGRHDQIQARWAARAAIDYARYILRADWNDDRQASKLQRGIQPYDYSKSDFWSVDIPPFPYDGGTFDGDIRDDSGKFNLNALVAAGQPVPAQVSALVKLLVSIPGSGIGAEQAKAMADTLVDWMDSDKVSITLQGAEESWYRAQPKRRIPPNAALVDLSEITQIRGFEQTGLLNTLSHYLTVHPDSAQNINVNEASEIVINAVLTGPHKIPTTRPLTNMNMLSLPAGTSVQPGTTLSIHSTYFTATGKASWGDSTVEMSFMLKRDQAYPSIVWYKIH